VIWLWDAARLTLTVDDSFYYFGIARHVAAGDGLTFGGVEPTSGFHPLWLALLVPFAPLLRAAPEESVRLVLTVQVLLVVVSGALLGRTASGERGRAAYVFAIASLLFPFTKVFVNGLESALELALLAWAIVTAERASSEMDARSRGRATILVGAVGGALTLSRLSALVVAFALVVVLVRRTRPGARVACAACTALLAPPIAYAVFLELRFGHPIPVSAAIKYGKGHLAWPLAVIPLAVITCSFAYAVRRELRSAAWPIWALPLGAGIAVQTGFDLVLRGVVLPEIWYLVPHATLFVLVGAHAIASRPRLRLAGGGLAIAAVPVAVARVDPVSYTFYTEAEVVGRWLAANTSADARVAGWDCGIVAFHADRPFLNLDGLAGSWSYKTEYLDRDRTREFLFARDVRYVAQHVAEGEPRESFHGVVDLSDWHVVLDRPYTFRGLGAIGRPAGRFHFVVLSRPR